MVRIYGLIDPRTGELRYVGKTGKSLNIRLFGHLGDHRRNHRTSWIKSVVDSGEIPDIFEIDEVPDDYWQESEKFWINYFRYIGANLTNSVDGGYGTNPSEYTKQKIRNSLLGHPVSVETRKKISRAGLGRKVSVETREKMSKPRHQYILSDEAREAIRRRNRGRKVTDETKQKLRKSRLGKHHSDDAKRKISAAHLGKKVSDSTKVKVSISQKMRGPHGPMPKSVKNKKSISMKLWWVNYKKENPSGRIQKSR